MDCEWHWIEITKVPSFDGITKSLWKRRNETLLFLCKGQGKYHYHCFLYIHILPKCCRRSRPSITISKSSAKKFDVKIFFFFLRAKLPIQITLAVWRYVFHDGWVSFGLSFDDQNIWDYNKDGEHWQIKNEPAGLVNLPWPMVSSCTTWSSLASISASSSRYSESIFTLIVAPPPSLPAAPGLPSVALWDEDLIVRSSAWTPFVVAGADGGGGGGAGLWNVDHFLFHH